jgi:hypothetical protein
MSGSLHELASMEFPNGNIEFPRSPVFKFFRIMMNESFIYHDSNEKEEIKYAKCKL